MYRAHQGVSIIDPTGLRPTGIVLAIIAALFFGSQFVNAIIPDPTVAPGPGTGPGSGPAGPDQPGATFPPIVVPSSAPLPPGSVLSAGPLRIPLLAGWQAASSPTSGAVATIYKGSVQVDLFHLPVSGGTATPANVYEFYMEAIGTDQSGTPRPGFASAQPSSITIDGGLAAARGAYTGVFGSNQVQGEVTAFLTGTSDGWVWDAWDTAGTLGSVLPETQRMIDGMQVVTQ